MKKTLLIIAALCASAPAYAQDTMKDDGNEVLTYCSPDASQLTRGVCLGYIQGLWAGWDALLTINKMRNCVPANVSLGQVRDVTVAYIRRNPATRHEGSIILFARAVTEAWGCK